MELKGKIHEISDVIVVSDKFKKQEIIVEYAENPSYPEYIKLEAPNDKIEKLSGMSVGDEATIHFNLRGRPWTDNAGKTTYFNTLSVWKVDVIGKGAPVATVQDDDLPPF